MIVSREFVDIRRRRGSRLPARPVLVQAVANVKGQFKGLDLHFTKIG